MRRIFALLIFIFYLGRNLLLLANGQAALTVPQLARIQAEAGTGPPQGYAVRFHPDVALYVGDWVSVEVLGPPGDALRESTLRMTVDDPRQTSAGPANFTPSGFTSRYVAQIHFAWDTRNLSPGSYKVDFAILPRGPAWSQVVSLLPSANRPADELNAHWKTVQIPCCVFYYISGTQAERDLSALEKLASDDAASVSQEFHAAFKDPVKIVWVPRVIGQGGLASSEIYLSYLQDNYAGGTTAQVLHHEMVHIMDNQQGGDFRPTMLVEGLAVYLSGGHFKPEPLLPRAAALLELGWYIPLTTLADQFYPSQHEVSYLESAALIEYMIHTWGWDAFNAFYRDIHPDPGGSQSRAIDAALRAHFGLSFAQLEDRFVHYLADQPIIPDLSEDVQLTILYYDAVRHYQQDLDPSAYFREIWLVPVKDMQAKDVTADYLRRPNMPENRRLEQKLEETGQAVGSGDFTRAWADVYSVNGYLETLDHAIQEFN